MVPRSPGYNISVPDETPKAPDAGKARAQSQAHKLEARAMLLIAAAVLIVMLICYWHHIPWSAR